MSMLVKNLKKIVLSLACILLIVFLIVQVLTIPFSPAVANDNHLSSSLEIKSARSRDSNEDLEYKSLTTFTTGGTKVTFQSAPDGQFAYIAIPPDANVTNAKMKVLGKMPDTINKYEFGGRHSYISGADFDTDGDIDLITTDKDNHTFYILLNDGNGYFNPVQNYPTGDLPLWGTINDLNNDGYDDIAFVNQGGDSITVYQNSATGDGTFINRIDYKIGDWPRSITSGDFNSDGWIDIASITSNDDKLWLNLNKGNNVLKFNNGTNITVEKSPVGIDSGDVNNDGMEDIVIINVADNISVNGSIYSYSVSVLINKGNAEFEPRVDYIVGKNPALVLLDDFNNDGWLDIATANRAGYDISVLLNNNDGTFGNSINYSLIDMPYSGRTMRTGDVNGDGYNDIVSVNSRMNTIQVLGNRGDGTFEGYINYIIPNRPVDLFLADLDDDLDLDAAVCSQNDGTVSIVPNNGDGTFSTFEFYYVGTRPQVIVHEDFDSDGDIDIASANYLGGTVSINVNDGKGYFNKQLDRKIAVEPYAITSGDFDSDGDIDIASADEALFKIVVLPNEGSGQFTEDTVSYDVGGFPYSIEFHDLNGDGYNEFITTNNHELSVSILHNYGNGSFAPFKDYSFNGHHPFGLGVDDMDGDGDEDIVITNYDADLKVVETEVTIIWNEGNGTFVTHTDYEVGDSPRNLKIADIDLDGDLDIITANEDGDSLTILFNLDNTSFGERRDYLVGPAPGGVEITDLNKDGYPDIVITNQQNNSVSLLYNLGDGKFTTHKEYLIGSTPIYITAADYDNDGSIDIATSNILTNTVSVRLDIHYPGNISVDIFADGAVDLIHSGQLSGAASVPDFTEKLKSYITAHKSEAAMTPYGYALLIPIKVASQQTGILELLDLQIDYLMPRDTDGDNIPDAEESDDDNDKMSDDWEKKYNLDPKNSSDAQLDSDEDKLTNLEEYMNNTSPVKADTDGDGFSDFEEVSEGYDPTDKNDHPPKEGNDICFTPGFTVELISSAIFIIIFIIHVSALYKRR